MAHYAFVALVTEILSASYNDTWLSLRVAQPPITGNALFGLEKETVVQNVGNWYGGMPLFRDEILII